METNTEVAPFQLYKNASLKKVVEHYKDNLEWNEIKVKPVGRFDLEEFVKSHKVYEISEIIPPEKSAHSFLIYAQELKKDFISRLNQLEKDQSILKDDKLKRISFCIRICMELESKYDNTNYFNFLFDFNWLVESNNAYHPIPFNNLKLNQDQKHFLYDEIHIRKLFFQWMKSRLELVFNTIRTQEFHDPMIRWNPNVKAKKIKIAELFYALRRSEIFDFRDESSKKRFYNNIEKLFDLKSVNWADLESDIRKRQKEGTKWIFLENLIGIKI